MASKRPAYILRDCNLGIAGVPGTRVGQVSEITLPVLEKKMESIRNAGMIKPRMVELGLVETGLSMKETAIDPEMLSRFAGNGPDESIIAYGYLKSESGAEHEARFEMRCDFTKIDFGAWKLGEIAPVDFATTVHSGRLVMDETEIIAFDDFEWSVGGVVQNPGRRRALRLS